MSSQLTKIFYGEDARFFLNHDNNPILIIGFERLDRDGDAIKITFENVKKKTNHEKIEVFGADKVST